MKRAVMPLIVLLAIAAAVAAAWYVLDHGFSWRGGAVRGGGPAVEARSLPPFTKIAVEGVAEVALVQGATESASVEAPARQLPHVRTEVRDGTLHIASEDRGRGMGFLFGGGPRKAQVTVTFRELGGIRADGAVKVRAEGIKTNRLAVAVSGASSLRIGALDAQELSVSGSGAMKAEVAGRVRDQKIAITGAGDYRAANLASDNAQITVSGAGKATVNAAKTLHIGISGAGSVDYIGDPQVTQDISGAGRVRRRDSALAQPATA
jgi:hypothetical protein